MDDEERSLAGRLRTASEDAAGDARPGAVERARRRLRVRRARLGVAAAIVAVGLAAASIQNTAAPRRTPSPRADASGPFATGSQAPSGLPTSPRPGETIPTGPGGSVQPTPPPTSPGRPPQESGCPPVAATQAPDGISVTLEVPKEEVLAGEPVTMIVRVRNGGSGAVTWPRATTQAYDFWVRRGNTVVWRWSRGRTFGPSAQTTTVQPGDEAAHAEVWDQSSCPEAGEAFPAAGRYVARALVRTAEGGWWSNPVEFVVR